MKDQLRRRRERTWELLVVMGVEYTQAVRRIADQFDCKETTVRTDISRMDTWLPDLDVATYSGFSRLRELRQARQRLRQFEMHAQQEEDYQLAATINDSIRANIQTEARMVDNLGLEVEDPSEVELDSGLDPEDEELVNKFCGIDGDGVDLEEMR